MVPDWPVLPHGPIEKLAENLWRVEGNLAGMPIKRVMTIVKREAGDLVVHNSIALEDNSMNQIDAWGEVRAIIVPNGFHRIDPARFKARYSSAKVYCPAGARKRVAKVVPVDATYPDFPNDNAMTVETLAGTADSEGALIVKSRDGLTLVLNDVLFNMPHVGGAHGFVLRHITKSTGGPRISRVGKMLLVKDKHAFKAHMSKLAATPSLKRVIVSHHEMITTSPRETIHAALNAL